MKTNISELNPVPVSPGKYSRVIRNLVFIVLAVVILLAGAFGVCVWKYYSLKKENPDAILATDPTYSFEDGKTVICTPFTMKMEFDVPWTQKPGNHLFSPVEGLQVTAPPVFKTIQYAWGKTRQSCTLSLQTYRTGKITPGTFEIAFAGSSGISVKKIELPPFESVFPEDGDDSMVSDGTLIQSGEIHDDVKPKRNPVVWYSWIFGAAAVVILLLVFLFRYFRKKKSQIPEKTSFEIALDAIAGLRTRIRGGSITPENAISDLTLVVRSFLEQVFLLKAEHQTTLEFLTELKTDTSSLSKTDRAFLRDFLSAADMVKYARIESDTTAFEAAADRAEIMIKSCGSRPQEENMER